MLSDLTIFAARLRDFIGICFDEPAFAAGTLEPAVQEHLDIEFNGLALVLFGLQFQHNPPYRKFCEARNVFPNAVSHWTQIPAIPTTAFKEWELTCLPPAERAVVFHSSGTTGQRPSRHFHSAESLAVYEASLLAGFRGNLTPDTARLLLLAPPPVQAPQSSLVHMFDVVRCDFGAAETVFSGCLAGDGSWTLRFESTLRALEDACGAGKPLVILGTAFSFVHLLDHLVERNVSFDLPNGSRVMETGGYKGRSRSLPKAGLHALITARLGIPADHIVCEYGMSELSSQAYDAGGHFHFPRWARAQVVSPESGREAGEGETGLLRIFDLANVFSVMAVQTEDMAVRRDDGFEMIGRAIQAEPRGCSLMTAAHSADVWKTNLPENSRSFA